MISLLCVGEISLMLYTVSIILLPARKSTRGEFDVSNRCEKN